MIWTSVFQGFLVLVATFCVVSAQNGLSSYGVPEEPLITSDTEQQKQADDHGGGHGGGHHHHSDNPLDWLRASVPGEPDVDYPIFNTPPDTGFECGDKADGIYADVDARCQAWHQCFADRKWSFLCPNGTIFNQEIFTCVWWFNFECDTAASFYSLNDNLYQSAGGDSSSTNNDGNRGTGGARNNGGNRGIGGASHSDQETGSSQGDILGVGIPSPREPSSPRRPIAQPKQPIAKPRPSAPKSPPRNTVTESIPVDSVPAHSRPSVPDQPIAPAVQPIRPVPTIAPQSIPQTPDFTPIDAGSQNVDPVPDTGVRGTGINPDYDNSEEEGYNYKVPENQLSLPKKRKKSSRQPPPSSDERLDAEAPLPIYGAPPEPFDDGSSHISNDILTPPVEEEEDVLPGYLPPDSRQGRQGRKGRRLSSGGRRGRRFNTFNRRRGRFIYL